MENYFGKYNIYKFTLSSNQTKIEKCFETVAV